MRATLLFVLACCLSALSQAAPIVLGNSSYSVYLSGQLSLNPVVLPAQFDGTTESFSRAGLTLALNESQSTVGDQTRIVIGLTADGDLYPTTGEAGIFGLGAVDGDGLDLSGDAFLRSAVVRLFINDDLLFTTANLADDYRAQHFSGAWDGLFSGVNSVFAVGNIGGRRVNRVEFDFLVEDFQRVPEPTTLALVGAALLVLAPRRRRLGAPAH